MAQRRMFSLRITNSGRFLKMPPSSQALYFHLGIGADDDGVVEAFPIMRTGGFAEDDLKVLVAKEFVKVLNEDLVTYIIDWKEHNLIRADRKINSIYKNLLVQVLPDVNLLKPKARADTGKSTGRPLDVHWTTNGPHRLGKVRLGKVSKDIYSDKSSSISIFLEEFNKAFNTKFRETDNRKKLLKQRLKSYSIEEVISAVKKMSSDPFYQGKNDRSWSADPDYLLRNDEQIDKFLNMKEKDKYSITT